MSESRLKFWTLAAVWGCAKALALMGLTIWCHALDPRVPDLAYGPSLLIVLAVWVVRQDMLDYMLQFLVHWVVPELDDEWQEDLP